MNKTVKRVVALVVMVALALGIPMWRSNSQKLEYVPLQNGAPVVMTINGDEVPADEYATYFYYNMMYYQNMYAQYYGLMGIWDDEQTAEMMGASLPLDAQNQAVYSHVILQEFEKAGLSLSETQKKELYQLRKDAIDQMGGYDTYVQKIAQAGFTDQTYTNFMYLTYVYSALNEYYFGENGINKPSDEELQTYFRENYLSAKHILLLTTDPSTGEVKRTDAEAQQEAQALLDRINAGEDFDALMKEYSEDGGLEGNPNGYIFTEGDMVTEFYEGTKALEPGEVSGLVKSSYGYHIIKRQPLDEGEFKNYQASVSIALGKTMDALLNQWMTSAEVETTDLFGEISYKNVTEYLPEEQKTAAAAAEAAAAASKDTGSTEEGAADTDGAQTEEK